MCWRASLLYAPRLKAPVSSRLADERGDSNTRNAVCKDMQAACTRGQLVQRTARRSGWCVFTDPCRCRAAGTYSSVVGASSFSTCRISDCGSGKYAGGPGASACSDCQAGKFSTDCSPSGSSAFDVPYLFNVSRFLLNSGGTPPE